MRIAEVKIYSFDELSPEAKKKALDYARERLTRNFDANSLTDYFKQELAKEGLPTEKVYWRLSSCQGDGVGFYGKVDAEKFVKVHKLKSKIPAPLVSGITFYSAFSFHIDEANYHYHHWNSGRVNFSEDDYGLDCPARWLTVAEWLKGVIQDRYVSMSRQLESDGYADIDYQNSDEYVTEYIRGNDFEYEESGKMF